MTASPPCRPAARPSLPPSSPSCWAPAPTLHGSAATHELFLDMERLTTAAGVRWGATGRLELGARLAFETTGGGVLDGFVSGWHTRLGPGNGNREKDPFGVYEQTLRDGEGRLRLSVPRRTLALEDARLSAKWRAWARADVALAALGRASWTRWHVHGALGGATARSARDHDGMLRDGSFFADVAVERSLAPWVSGVAQLSIASPRLQGFDEPEVDGWPVNLAGTSTGARLYHFGTIIQSPHRVIPHSRSVGRPTGARRMPGEYWAPSDRPSVLPNLREACP